MGRREVAEIVEEIVALSIEWRAKRLSKDANRLFDSQVRATRELREHGQVGLDALRELLHHEVPAVSSWAGACLLVSHPDEAIPVLEAVENLRATQALLSFSAEMCLKEYRAGRFKPPA